MSATLPVFEIPTYPGTNVQGGAMASAKSAAPHPTLDLRNLPRPPRQVSGPTPSL